MLSLEHGSTELATWQALWRRPCIYLLYWIATLTNLFDFIGQLSDQA
jgi:hypothetical protein